jgi:hypothetical protein
MSDSLVATPLGVIAEGQLQHLNGDWVIVDDDGDIIPIPQRFFEKYLGKRVRISLADLTRLDKLVELGMTPGKEMEFVATLTEKQIEDLLGGDE